MSDYHETFEYEHDSTAYKVVPSKMADSGQKKSYEPDPKPVKKPKKGKRGK